MNPRRLLPYLIIFLVLVGAYAALKWQQGQQETREKEAKRIFKVQEKEVGILALIRPGQEVRLVKKDHDWQLLEPLKARADQAAVDELLVTLAGLRQERDLGVQKDLKSFGLDQPQLVVEFAAQGQTYRLAIGSQAPGAGNYYARQDQEPNVLLISTASKDSLDRALPALRDKTLLTFNPAEVKALKIKAGKTGIDLQKTGTQTWHWVGRADFKVRPDRVEALLRQLHAARVKDFLEQLPKQTESLGLAPQPRTEVILVTGKGSETLWLGTAKDGGVYARKGADGPVLLVEQSLADEIAKAASSLEDRRLWAGPANEARKVVWGTPGKLWTATKAKESWDIKGPEGAALQQPAVRLELALWKLQNLEYGSMMPEAGPGPGQAAFVLEVFAGGDQPAFRLEELGKKGEQVEVKARKDDKTATALVPAKNFAEIQADLARLTTPPPQRQP
jgi:hypothetical protein